MKERMEALSNSPGAPGPRDTARQSTAGGGFRLGQPPAAHAPTGQRTANQAGSLQGNYESLLSHLTAVDPGQAAPTAKPPGPS